MPESHVSELTLPAVVATARGGHREAVAATVLYHPNPERVGDVALLGPGSARLDASLSRLGPLFGPAPEKPGGRPLEDLYLSRAPVALTGGPAGVTIRAPSGKRSLRANGSPVEGTLQVPWGEVDDGIVLSMAHRVVLLLHTWVREDDANRSAGLVGNSTAMRRVRRLIGRVAAEDTPVLLLGESGTGKELVAAAIHRDSARRDGPFIPVNMAALPTDLAAAELFGVRRGAFTGADCDRPGYFQQADGGTLFLDEVGACEPAVQPLLLRALQQGEIQQPGGGARRVNVRVIAATDADLESDDLRFSTALRHRLSGFEIKLPPLRARREDLGSLLLHFLPASLMRDAGNHALEASRWADLVEKMALYHWPGNVRELSNWCSQLAIATGDTGQLVVPESLADLLSSLRPVRVGGCSPGNRPSDGRVREAMLAARWEVAEAARLLKISRQALYRRIESIPGLRVAADIPGVEVETAYHECSGDIDEAALRLQVSRAALRRRWRAMDLLSDER